MILRRFFTNWLVLYLVLMFSIGVQYVSAEPVITIQDNGDPANRVDIVILGDGYTQTELDSGKYATDVQQAVNHFFDEEPFAEYRDYFNVHRVDVESNESGADHPERNPPVYKDTVFDATYNCANIQRLICVNTSKVNEVLYRSVNADEKDTILVIVNDPEYGGSGGYLAVISTNIAFIELFLHEVGHSFGLLADEYDSGECSTFSEPSEPNVTRETNRNQIKWNVGGGPPAGWIDPSTPVPTNNNTLSVPGLYEGAKYCPTGVYRPTYNSKMRSLGVPFDQINEEQLVKRTYNWVSPIDSSTPLETDLELRNGQNQDFMVTVLDPATHSLIVEWFLDGSSVGTDHQFTFDSSALGLGTYTIEGQVSNLTSKVRTDPSEVLIEIRSWTIEVVDATLIANFIADTTSGVAPLTVDFTDESTGDITSYLWDFGDGETSIEENPTYTYADEGIYTVSLTVSGPAGSDSEVKTGYITVSEPDVTIEAILDFFDDSVADGSLIGVGQNPWFAKLRLYLMREMLVIAKELIEQEKTDWANFILCRAVLRCDSDNRPPDFVKGEAVYELNDMILDLMENLGCK